MQQPFTAQGLYDEGVRTFFLLDFDGAVNQVPPHLRRGDAPSEDTYASVEHLEVEIERNPLSIYPDAHDLVQEQVHFSPLLVEHLNALLQDPSRQLLWATYWNANILRVQDSLGLRPLRSPRVLEIFRKFSDYEGTFSKVQRVLRFFEDLEAEEEVRLVWVDDVVIPRLLPSSNPDSFLLEELEEAMGHLFPPERRLLIPSDPTYGLLPSQVDTLRTFLDA